MDDIEKLKEEVRSLHRKLAAAELDARLGWERYTAENVKYKAKEKELMELKHG